jgi:hypothetical protein
MHRNGVVLGRVFADPIRPEAVPRPPFPKTLREFQSDFATEEACQRYLAACRWPDGFTCPRRGHGKAYELVNQRRQLV